MQCDFDGLMMVFNAEWIVSEVLSLSMIVRISSSEILVSFDDINIEGNVYEIEIVLQSSSLLDNDEEVVNLLYNGDEEVLDKQ